MSRKEKAESQKETALIEHSIFTGLTFTGEPATKEEYLDHYDEYRKRCNGQKNERVQGSISSMCFRFTSLKQAKRFMRNNVSSEYHMEIIEFSTAPKYRILMSNKGRNNVKLENKRELEKFLIDHLKKNIKKEIPKWLQPLRDSMKRILDKFNSTVV